MILEQFKLTGKAAIVTGASKGLGLAMAEGLAEAGADVALVARGDLSAARERVEAAGRRAVEIRQPPQPGLQAGGPLKFQALGRRLHPPPQLLRQAPAVPRGEIRRPPHRRAIFGHGDRTVAGAQASSHPGSLNSRLRARMAFS